MYKVKSFLLQEIEQGYVLQNGISTVLITNIRLVDFLKRVEKNRIKEVQEEFFLEVFKDESQSVIEFLLDNKVIKKIKKPRLNFNKIYLLTNDSKFSRLFNYATEDFEEKIKIFSLNNYKTIINKVDEDSLCIIFLNPFNLEKYIEVCNQLIETKMTLRTSFFYNHSIYISNLYKKGWYNPCPKCFFYALETQLRASISSSINFQTMMDLIYTKNSRFNVVSDLTHLDLNTIMTLLLKDIKFKENLNTINNVYELDLGTYRLTEDSSYHWELCDCYE